MNSAPKPELFQLMADQVRDYAIFLLDPQGRVQSWNIGAERIKGYTADEIVGQHFSVFYTPLDIARDWPTHELHRALTEGRFEDEGWRVKKDGSRFWANVVITALRDESGTLLAYSKITRDLTGRKAQEETLRQSEERFRLLVDGVEDYAIYMLDPAGIVSSWNVGACRIKGYESSEIIGRHFSRFYSAEDIQAGKPWAELAIARQSGRAEDEGWRLRKDGARFWARVVVTALYDRERNLLGFAKVTQDLTLRRHTEALEASAANVNAFIAVLAHELRNPLAPIRNAIHMLGHIDPKDQPAQEQLRQIIDRQSSQLSRIVDDLLDVNRVTRGALSVTPKPVDVAQVIARSTETARPNIEAGKHKLEIDIPPGPLQIEADEVRIVQALANLLNNAARYTDPGGSIFVRVKSLDRTTGSMVQISVRDTGRGIDASLLGSIFGMFVQGKNAYTQPASGLGVGLALARSIVELHHGTLEARSEGIGKGSEFVVTLPAIPPAADGASMPKRERPRQQPGKTVAPSRRRVLVVDDNADAAGALASLLRSYGHDVVESHDGKDALQVAEDFCPEVVLLDIGMPDMSGFEVARRLRERNAAPRPLIVAITGWGKQEDQVRSRDAGFDLHLVKPVEEKPLMRVMETATLNASSRERVE